MRVEKISDTQMKFVLMNADLEERDIKINELSYASYKTQQLFREIMQLVQNEDEFSAENTPLMFEAIRTGVDTLVVMVTKIEEGSEESGRFNLIPAAKSECRFKRGGAIAPPGGDNLNGNEDSYSMFSFDDLDDMASSINRLYGNFSGPSQVYKMDGRYFLLLQNETEDRRTTGEMEAILYEFGQKHVSNVVSRHYLAERGEAIISENAVEKLRAYNSSVARN